MAFNQPRELIFLATRTASGGASLEFKSLITSQYPVYYVKIRALVPATDATTMLVTFSTDNGGTYLNANYKWNYWTASSAAAAANTRSASDSSCSILNNQSSTSTNGLYANLYLYNFASSNVASYNGMGIKHGSDSVLITSIFDGLNTTTTPVNAIKFAYSGGSNITSGTITLYGVKT